MIIRFKQNAELEVVTGFDEENDVSEVENQIFNEGEEVEIDKISDSEIQFGDGSVCFVTKDFWIELVQVVDVDDVE
jgi:hypothetical protein